MKDTLTPNEWIVMNALWSGGGSMTLSETIAAIGGRASWNYKTYQSYMLVLERKGCVGSDKRGRDKFYYPLVTREQCIECERTSLVGKMQAESIKLLVAAMVREGDLQAADFNEILASVDNDLNEEGGK